MKKVFLCIISLALVLCTGCGLTAETPDTGASSPSSDTGFSVSMSPATTEAVTTEPEPVYKATFAGAGDNIIYYGNVRDAAALAVSGGREYNFTPAYTDVEGLISSADIAFINQETVMCGDGYELSYYPLFNSPRDLAYDLCDVGFDVINIANNHMLDKGGAGLGATIDFWKTMPVTLIGGYSTTDEFYSVPIVETNGIRIAYISYCEMTNGMTIGNNYSIHIPYLDEADIKRQTDSVRDKCDFIIASVHWGDEGSFEPNENQRHWAKVFADCGVDVILGHHPHVIQPIEWIDGKDSKTLCVYSLGNFMAEQDRDYHMLGGIITFDITKTGNTRAKASNVVFEPTVFYFPSNFYNNHIYFLKDFTEQLASSHGVNTYYRHTLTLEGLIKILTDTVSSEFLPDYINAEK